MPTKCQQTTEKTDVYQRITIACYSSDPEVASHVGEQCVSRETTHEEGRATGSQLTGESRLTKVNSRVGVNSHRMCSLSNRELCVPSSWELFLVILLPAPTY